MAPLRPIHFRKFPSAPKAAPGAGSYSQGSALRSDERQNPPPLTAARAVRRGWLRREFASFFKREPRLKTRRKEEKQNARKTARQLGGTSTRCGRKAGQNASGLCRISQLQLRKCIACARTVRAAQPAART